MQDVVFSVSVCVSDVCGLYELCYCWSCFTLNSLLNSFVRVKISSCDDAANMAL